MRPADGPQRRPRGKDRRQFMAPRPKRPQCCRCRTRLEPEAAGNLCPACLQAVEEARHPGAWLRIGRSFYPAVEYGGARRGDREG